MHLLTSDKHLGIAMAIATLSSKYTVVVDDSLDSESVKEKLQEQYSKKMELRNPKLAECPTQYVEHSRPSKHHCNRALKPRKNKAQAKSRRANRK